MDILKHTKICSNATTFPDVNPTEHVWGYLIKRPCSTNISSNKLLKMTILEEWSTIWPNLTAKLVHSMPK